MKKLTSQFSHFHKSNSLLLKSTSKCILRNYSEHKTISYAIINTNNLLENVENIIKFTKKHNNDTQVMPVVKANAYGHGVTEVTKLLQNNLNVKRVAVNRVEEGIQLRKENPTIEIFILGFSLPNEIEACIEHSLIPSFGSNDEHLFKIIPQILNHCKLLNKKLKIHLKIDTGMGRYGIVPNQLENILNYLYKKDKQHFIEIEGIFTHFSSADDDYEYTKLQFNKFLETKEIINQFANKYQEKLIYHCCNSAATLFYPGKLLFVKDYNNNLCHNKEMHMDLVRTGICMYGLSPTNVTNDERLPFPLKPVLSIYTHIGRIVHLPKNSPISYGNTYVTKEDDELIALIPIGYGDGFHRRYSKHGYVLIHGEKCKIVGRVCMDQFVVSIPTNLKNKAKVGDEVIILGDGGKNSISSEEISQWGETINYEVTTCLLPRLKRIYI
ncbi:hypothetical protein ABK040_002143 [Willaertia magna]